MTTYLLDEMIVRLRVSVQEQKVSLSDIKKSQDEMSDGKLGHISKLLTVNGNAFLVSQSPLESKIWIIGTNGAGDALINGLLEFNESNRDKANNVVDKVLSAISYKR